MRKLATATAVSLALASGGAFGLGLGEIEMQSALNQPMNAEIPLTAVNPGELEGMIVQLASPEAFQRAGIERTDAIAGLRFRVDSSSGAPVIRIESDGPVEEPFLNFLLEVDWPQGRMVREYTVLLDPPVFMTPSASEQNPVSTQAAVLEDQDSALVVPTPIERNNAESAAVDGVAAAGASAEEAIDSGLVDLSDSALGANDGALVSDSEGRPITLTDSSAANTDAAAQRQAEAARAALLADIEVEVADTLSEVADDLVVGADGELQVSTATTLGPVGDDGGVIVSLDSIEEPVEAEEPVERVVDAGVAGDVTVARGDTLFEIASDRTPGGVSVQQMMLAILAANESSFINNNINLVRAGSILRIPDAAEAARLTQEQALAAISDQNRLWQDYRDSLRDTASTQVAQNIAPEPDESATADTATEEAAEQTEIAALDPLETTTAESEAALGGLSSEARAILENARREILDGEELRIVADNAPEDTDTVASATADETSESDESARLGAINRRLQLAREELSSSRLRTDDLSDQAIQLQDTTDNLQAMVSMRQDEIARLQTQIAEARRATIERMRAASNTTSGAQDNAAGTDADAAGDDTAQGAADAVADAAQNATDAAGDVASDAAQAAGDAADAAGDTAQDALDAAGNVAQNAADAVGDTAQNAVDTVSDTARNATDAAGDAVDAVADGVSGAADAAAGLAGDAVDGVAGAADEATDALSAASERAQQAISGTAESVTDSAAEAAADASDALGSVAADTADAVDGLGNDVADAAGSAIDSATDSGALTAPAQDTRAWYQSLLDDPKRLAIAGIGGLGLLGFLGTLLYKRKRKEPDSEAGLEAGSDTTVKVPAAPNMQAVDKPNLFDGTGRFDEEDVAGVAGVSAAAGFVGSPTEPEKGEIVDYLDKTMADENEDPNDRTLAFDASEQEGLPDFADQDGTTTDNDDTIAEADVYLAYGLHGQAEELLTRAIERDPGNAEYFGKLLQTYHAQGNRDAFRETAATFHQRFGGDTNPGWPAIAAMGAEIDPGDALYAQATDTVLRQSPAQTVKSAASTAAAATAAAAGSAAAASAAAKSAASEMDYSSAIAEDLDKSLNDTSSRQESYSEEAARMDESLDPAFAFDESDLEATGDFSGIADDLAAENTADFSDSRVAANENIENRAENARAAYQRDGSNDGMDDLTLDLDELSGDLELDSADLLNADLSDLDLPDLTADNELLLDSTGQFGTGADEMDTMMDLAKAYIDMGDKDSASSALGEIVKSGSPEQVNEAETLLRNIS